jgi:hypothetical protein
MEEDKLIKDIEKQLEVYVPVKPMPAGLSYCCAALSSGVVDFTESYA